MTPLCVVQARMGSTRFPGKVMAEIAGMPALALQLRRLLHGDLEVVVATSTEAKDGPVAALAADLGVAVVRGAEADVLDRFRLTAERFPDADPVVRLTADCPLTDPEVVRRALDVHARTRADHTSNVLARTYPDGFDVEVVRRSALLAAAGEAAGPDEREHVTPYILRRPDRFALASICSGQRAGLLRLTLDTVDDLTVLRDAAACVRDPVGAPWHDFCEVPDPPPGLSVWPRCREGWMADRRFDVLVDAEEVGAVVVTVDAGVGTVDFSGPDAVMADSVTLVQRWLRLDQQVVAFS